MKLIFQEKKKEEDDATTFIFQPPKDFSWRAGQYLFYTLPTNNPDNRGITRYFTISSAPEEKFVSITTRINKDSSTFKKTLDKLKPGYEIEASGPDGEFIIEDTKRSFVFIAGGVGITPFHSILREVYLKKKKLNAILLYANRNDEPVFGNELESIKDKIGLKIEYFILPAQIDQNVLRSIVNNQSSIINHSFYISGANSFVRIIRDTLKEEGVGKENIKTDMFSGYSSI